MKQANDQCGRGVRAGGCGGAQQRRTGVGVAIANAVEAVGTLGHVVDAGHSHGKALAAHHARVVDAFLKRERGVRVGVWEGHVRWR